MRLVDHQHLVGQPLQPQRGVANRQSRQQCLIQRTNADLRQQRPAAIVGQPSGTLRLRLVLRTQGAGRGRTWGQGSGKAWIQCRMAMR
ncbi:hypothetical protein ACFQU7_42100 [Pseudoroseomonas wenyumeiae]